MTGTIIADRHRTTPRGIQWWLAAAGVLAIAWGALAFGSVYPWAYKILAASCTAIGLAALLAGRRGRPPVIGLAVALLAILATIGLQLVPLPLDQLQRISPATDAFLAEYDFAYQLAHTGTGFRHAISIAPGKTMVAAGLFAAFAIFMLGMARAISTVGSKPIARWLVGFGGILAIVGIAQRGFTSTEVQPLIYGFWRPQFESTPFGPFVNPNHFAGWMVMCLPLGLAMLFDLLLQTVASAPRRGNRIAVVNAPQFGAALMVAGICTVMGLSLAMTRSRSALAAFAVATIVASVLMARRQTTRAGRTAVAGAAAFLLVAAGAWAGLDTVTSKFVERQGEKSFVSRLQAWRDTRAIVRDFGAAGSGLDTYGTAMMLYQTTNRRLHFQEAHNDYLQIAAEGGLLVGVPALAALVVFVRAVRARFREAPRVGTTYCLRVGAVAGLLAIALQSLVEFSLQMPGNAAFFALLCALALHRSPNLPASSVASAHGR